MVNKLKEKISIMKKNVKGFTLMELIVVVAILGFLVALLAPKYMNYTDKAMGVAAAADSKGVMSIASTMLMDTNKYPTDAEVKTALGLTGTTGEKALTGTGPKYTYTYTKGGIVITATIDIDDSVISYVITGTGTDAKKGRVKDGIGNNNNVTISTTTP